MGSPIDHLPKSIEKDQISHLLHDLQLPRARSISTLSATSASFHVIYVLSFDHGELSQCHAVSDINWAMSHPCDLILRVSGNHIPQIKTENEVAIMSWLNNATKIPVPKVIAFDSSNSHALGYEYILMTRAQGRCMAEVYHQMSEDQIQMFIDQIVDIQVQLNAHEWSHIGGLRLVEGLTRSAPYVAEDQWFSPEIPRFFPGETFVSINALGPFESYVESIVADIEKYVHIINIHDTLAWMKSTVPLLRRFVKIIWQRAKDLNRTKLRIAHKDLHFGNIVVDPETANITAILDWEFSGPVPCCRWDPHRAFLWNTESNSNAKREQRKLVHLFRTRARERGYNSLLDDGEYSSPLQEQMQIVRDYCRAITEVCPRGQRQELGKGWKEALLTALKAFDIQ